MRKAKVFLALAALAFLIPWPVAAQDETLIKGQDEGEFRRPIRTDTSGRLQGVQGQKLLDSCDATTGWTALSNDTTGIAAAFDHVEGAKSLEFDKVDGAAGLIFGGVQKTLVTAVDIEQYMENSGFVLVSLNLSDLTDVAYCFVRLGTDASNYNEWRIDDDALGTGWQQVRYAFYVPDTAGNLGNGIDASAITYVALGCAFDLETSALADIRVDNIAVNAGSQVSADVQSQAGAVSGAGNTSDNPLYVSSAGGMSTTISQGPTATDATPDLVLSSTDISKESCWGLSIQNAGANPLTDADVQISRDFGTTWSSLTWTSCDSLAAGSVCDYDFPLNSHTNVRVYTTSTAGTTVTLLLSSRR